MQLLVSGGQGVSVDDGNAAAVRRERERERESLEKGVITKILIKFGLKE